MCLARVYSDMLYLHYNATRRVFLIGLYEKSWLRKSRKVYSNATRIFSKYLFFANVHILRSLMTVLALYFI